MSGVVAQNILSGTGLIKAPEGGGAWTFISKLTADGSGTTLTFTSGLDSTYKEYMFTFNDIHLQTHGATLGFDMSTDSGDNYGTAKTTTLFYARHEFNSCVGEAISYYAGGDLAQGTGFQIVLDAFDATYKTASDTYCGSGWLHLYDPASTTFVKNFLSLTFNIRDNEHAEPTYVSGYGNTASAVDAIQFKASSGNIDDGDICLYGLTT